MRIQIAVTDNRAGAWRLPEAVERIRRGIIELLAREGLRVLEVVIDAIDDADAAAVVGIDGIDDRPPVIGDRPPTAERRRRR